MKSIGLNTMPPSMAASAIAKDALTKNNQPDELLCVCSIIFNYPK